MKLIEYSNLLGYVIAYDDDNNSLVCVYYYANYAPSDEVISAIRTFFGDVTLILTNDADMALEMCNTPRIDLTEYNRIRDALDEVSGDFDRNR